MLEKHDGHSDLKKVHAEVQTRNLELLRRGESDGLYEKIGFIVCLTNPPKGTRRYRARFAPTVDEALADIQVGVESGEFELVEFPEEANLRGILKNDLESDSPYSTMNELGRDVSALNTNP